MNNPNYYKPSNLLEETEMRAAGRREMSCSQALMKASFSSSGEDREGTGVLSMTPRSRLAA